ncbi:MAG TPA: hypothetical protein VMJ10_35370 [Kofleriaceae bacterium]|nr:hypothetical protein [Kofleriaceae bacterium]
MDDLDATLVLLQLVPATHLLFGAIAAALVLYVTARWRAYRDGIVDAQLGMKVALSFFAVIAFQLVLLGTTLFLYAVLSGGTSDARGALFRHGLALFVAGSVVLATHLVLLARTNQARYPQVRRLADGFNLLVTGVLGFGALVLAFESLFRRGSSHEVGRIAGAAVLVYGMAWAAVGVRFARVVLDDESHDDELPPPPAMPRVEPPRAPPPRPDPPPGDAPALPALGGGAFPPIDHK